MKHNVKSIENAFESHIIKIFKLLHVSKSS